MRYNAVKYRETRILNNAKSQHDKCALEREVNIV